MKIKQILAILSSLLLISSCAQKDSDKIGDAQACLDKAKTSAQANTCIAKVSGINSSSADGIRCAGKFIGEGFSDPQKYISALNNLSGGGGVTGLMSALSFSSQNDITTDTDNAETTFGFCANSGGKGATLLAVFAYLNNAIYEFVSSGSGTTGCESTPTATGYSFVTCMTAGINANDTNVISNVSNILNLGSADNSAEGRLQSALGASILTTYNISCGGGTINSDMCTTLKNSVTGNTANTRSIFRTFICSIATITGC